MPVRGGKKCAAQLAGTGVTAAEANGLSEGGIAIIIEKKVLAFTCTSTFQGPHIFCGRPRLQLSCVSAHFGWCIGMCFSCHLAWKKVSLVCLNDSPMLSVLGTAYTTFCTNLKNNGWCIPLYFAMCAACSINLGPLFSVHSTFLPLWVSTEGVVYVVHLHCVLIHILFRLSFFACVCVQCIEWKGWLLEAQAFVPRLWHTVCKL